MEPFCRTKLRKMFLWMKGFIVESYLHDSCWFTIIETIASKHKLNTKSIKDKYSALKEGKTENQSRR